jgi:cob(I)alamin adenosyltransferase
MLYKVESDKEEKEFKMEKKMRIYTRTGDDGTSGLIGGTRVSKFDARLEAYGTVDELNSWIGVVRSNVEEKDEKEFLIDIQNKLFNIGARLATDTSKTDISGKLPCCKEDIENLEKEMDRINDLIPPLTKFILPGGSNVVAFCHLARTVCRRAERRAFEVAQNFDVPEEVLKYLNRLSDYLFVLSRRLSNKLGIDEIQWKP